MPRLRTALLLPAVALFLGLAPGRPAAGEGFALMTVEELSRALGAPDLKVFDANSPSTFAKGHLPGAVNVDYEDMEEAELPADKATRVVFYCKSRFWTASHKAARRAVTMGFTRVFVMEEGVDGWVRAGLPVVTGKK